MKAIAVALIISLPLSQICFAGDTQDAVDLLRHSLKCPLPLHQSLPPPVSGIPIELFHHASLYAGTSTQLKIVTEVQSSNGHGSPPMGEIIEANYAELISATAIVSKQSALPDLGVMFDLQLVCSPNFPNCITNIVCEHYSPNCVRDRISATIPRSSYSTVICDDGSARDAALAVNTLIRLNKTDR
jgi:hypothetical protein